MTLDIAHDTTLHRFEATIEGEHCTLDYELDGDTMTITHVVVPDPVSRRGIAAALMCAALESARGHGWRVVPQCPYAAHYVKENPEWSGLMVRH